MYSSAAAQFRAPRAARRLQHPTKKVTDTISTGGKFRVDEMAYDPKAHVVIVANNAGEPPFLTLISSKPGHKVMAKIAIEDATDGVETACLRCRDEKVLCFDSRVEEG
ncbi:hypothetical protein NUH87_20895 [Pseudomonas batumici]|uniref:hypothetical protein n=1 Tax=Pseudomonas batumici TaxID=226910 RepID=UPI0030CB975C